MLRAQKGVSQRREDIGELNQGILFFSNRLEKLLLHLKANLFFPGSCPFTERILILPSVEMKRWIMLQLAEQMEIAAGIEFYSLPEALCALCNATADPPALQWTLQIYDALYRHLEDVEFHKVASYIEGRERRALALCHHLAYLFHRYSIYGVEKWSHPWQEILWNEVGFTWNVKPTDKAVHLFGFSHIPPQFFPCFRSFFYFLSPCKEFWSEQVSHPLLADLGYVGSIAAKEIEDSGAYLVEDYEQEGLTPTQASLLHLEPLETDETIEFHIASSPYREVEICYHNILSLFDRLSPKDILVMAPNISEYEQQIRAIFGPLCQITDLPSITLDVEMQAIILLLELEKKRWSAPAILELFKNPLLQKKKGLGEESVLLFKKWLQKTGVRFGVNAEHRGQIVGESSDVATFKQGVAQLLEALACGGEHIDLTQAELLAIFAQTIEDLFERVKLLYSDVKWPLFKWVDYIKELYESHFAFENGSLFSALETLLFPTKSLYSGEAIRFLLGKLLKLEQATYRPQETNVIRFCSLLPLRAIPSKVIYLLGMNQDHFPRREESFSLDELKNVPSKTDQDRYLFLETLLSYREKLFISFLDTSEEPPSEVLQRVKAKIIKHPPASHDPSYFYRKELKNYSKTDYEIAKARSLPHSKEPLFAPPPEQFSVPEGCHEITLEDLQKALRSPLAHYFAPLHFYEELPLKEEEEFTLSARELAKFHRLLLKMPLAQAHAKMQKEGLFPAGKFFQMEDIREITVLPKSVEITLKFSETRSVKIKAEIEGLTDEGLIRFERYSFANAIKVLPAYLIASIDKPVDLWLGQKRVAPFFTNALAPLKELVHYYFLAKQFASPLFPHWVEPIIEGKSLPPLHDAALKWALETKELGEQIYTWKEMAVQLFGEMKDDWF